MSLVISPTTWNDHTYLGIAPTLQSRQRGGLTQIRRLWQARWPVPLVMIQEEVCRGHRTGPRIPINVQRRRTPFDSQACNARASHADRPLAWVATIQQAPGRVVRRYNVATNDCWEGQDRILDLLSRCVDRQGYDSAIHILTRLRIAYPLRCRGY